MIQMFRILGKRGRIIFSDEALWNFQVYLAQKEDPSYDPGPYVPYDWNGGVKPTIEDLGNGSKQTIEDLGNG